MEVEVTIGLPLEADPLNRRDVAARIRAACVERLRRENILG
jgi:hypothetical protein